MIAIIDYGVGNLRSVLNALRRVGGNAKVTSDYKEISEASALILPGVGAFKTAMEKIRGLNLEFPSVPKLGICLGMQLFAVKSYEDGIHEGLGFIPGEVVRFPSAVGKIPHMGWNEVRIRRDSELLYGIENGSMFYFVHSYYVKTEDRFVVAETEYGITFASVIEFNESFGVQFHPEKSGEIGLEILRNFVRITKR